MSRVGIRGPHLDGHQIPEEDHVYTIKLYSRKKARSNDSILHTSYNAYTNLTTGSSYERHEDVELKSATTSSDTKLPNPALEVNTNVRVEYVDDKNAEHDEFARFDWLEPVDVFVTANDGVSTSALTRSKQVGFCMAKLVRKEKIRARFHENMRKPFSELTSLAFDLFDGYGTFRYDYKYHHVRKGSGCWNDQLDTRDILLIEDVHVDEEYREQGIGSSMIAILQDVVSHKTRNGEFVTIVWPESLKASRLHQTMEYLIGYAQATSTVDCPDYATIDWFRSLGFRRIGSSIWFGLNYHNEGSSRVRALLTAATNLPLELQLDDISDYKARQKVTDMVAVAPLVSVHLCYEILMAKKGHLDNACAEALQISERRHDKSKKLPSIWTQVTMPTAQITAEEDYDPPCPTLSTLPERIAQAATVSPAEFFRGMTAHFFFIEASDDQWFATDSAGNTILHLAAFIESYDAIDWILNRCCGVELLWKRNGNGDTPLGTLRSKLEKTRTRRLLQSSIKVCSDQFERYDYKAVQCLVKLKGLQDPSRKDLQRLEGGCTCGGCIEGCMSLRMRMALIDEAELICAELKSGLPSISGTDYFAKNEYLLACLSEYCKAQQVRPPRIGHLMPSYLQMPQRGRTAG